MPVTINLKFASCVLSMATGAGPLNSIVRFMIDNLGRPHPNSTPSPQEAEIYGVEIQIFKQFQDF